MTKIIVNLKIIIIIQINTEVLQIAHTSRELAVVVFHNGSKYDHKFIVKELVKEFKGPSKCIGENTKKYITFSVLIENVLTHVIKKLKK